MTERLLDLRGLRCPWPALRVGRALREGESPVVAVADDPLAAREIGAIASARGWTAATQPTAIGEGLRLEPSMRHRTTQNRDFRDRALKGVRNSPFTDRAHKRD